MKIKNLLSFAFAAVLSVSLAACGSATPETETSQTDAIASTESTTSNSSATSDDSTDLAPQVQAIKDRGTLRVGVKVDVPKFGYNDPDTKQMEGMEVDLAKALAKSIIGDENAVDFQGVTAQTRGPLLDNGEVDVVIATFTIKPERLEQWNFSQPYFVDEIGFLVKTKDGYKDITDLDGKNIGVAQSATTKDALQEKADELGIKFKFQEYSSYPELKTALTTGRIDAFSVDKSILYGYLDDSTEILEYGFSPQEYGIVTKKSNEELAAYVENFVEQIQSDGTMNSILEKWGLETAK